jgi:hypothetical protein
VKLYLNETPGKRQEFCAVTKNEPLHEKGLVGRIMSSDEPVSALSDRSVAYA